MDTAFRRCVTHLCMWPDLLIEIDKEWMDVFWLWALLVTFNYEKRWKSNSLGHTVLLQKLYSFLAKLGTHNITTPSWKDNRCCCFVPAKSPLLALLTIMFIRHCVNTYSWKTSALCWVPLWLGVRAAVVMAAMIVNYGTNDLIWRLDFHGQFIPRGKYFIGKH